jgi:hypothetical protein
MPGMNNTAYQMEVMGVVGYAVFWCQQVESAMSNCLLLSAKPETDDTGEIYFNIWNPEEMVASNRKKPLGRLIGTLKFETWFTSPLRKRLSRFVSQRNELIHHCFRDYRSAGRRSDLQRIHKLASRILRDAFYFHDLFDAFLGMQYELTLDKIPVRKREKILRILDAKQRRGDYAKLANVLKSRPPRPLNKPV